MKEFIIVLCTVKEKKEANKIAGEIVKNKLAACVNIIEGLTSIYEWQDETCSDSECLMIIKTKSNLFEKLKESILSMHSYELPEIISLPVNNGLESYLNWVDKNTL